MPVLVEGDGVIMSAWRVIIPPCSRRGDGSRAVCFAIGFLIVSVSFLVPPCCPFRFSSLFAPPCDTAGGEMPCGVSFSCGLVACAVACRAWGGAACPHGVLSSWVVLAVVREGVLCGLCGWSGCLSFLWYICIIN